MLTKIMLCFRYVRNAYNLICNIWNIVYSIFENCTIFQASENICTKVLGNKKNVLIFIAFINFFCEVLISMIL